MAKISINKLGEYLITSNPNRRKSIITEQKTPNSFAVPRYRNAYGPIHQFLSSYGTGHDAIYSAIDALRLDLTGSEWKINDNQNTAEALENFIDVSDSVINEDYTYLLGDTNPPKLVIAGVDISVRPDIIIHFNKRNVECIGAIKLHFIKDEEKALTVDGAQYVGVMLYEWLKEFGEQGKTPQHSHCFVIDCFRKQVTTAPANYRRRLQHIETACSEILNQWDFV